MKMAKLPEGIRPDLVLLLGTVGSQAYGMATEDSDTDYLGVFAWPTGKILGLGKPHDSIVTHEPDLTLHEIGKFCRLAISCNPTAMEILWLHDYEKTDIWGDRLIGIRQRFLSAKRVRDAYLGYATQQLRRMETRAEEGKWAEAHPDTRKKIAKHARHLIRLCQQGQQLHTTGYLKIKLDDPQYVIDVADKIAEGEIWLAKKIILETEKVFDEQPSVLPEKPSLDHIEDLLIRIRRFFF